MQPIPAPGRRADETLRRCCGGARRAARAAARTKRALRAAAHPGSVVATAALLGPSWRRPWVRALHLHPADRPRPDWSRPRPAGADRARAVPGLAPGHAGLPAFPGHAAARAAPARDQRPRAQGRCAAAEAADEDPVFGPEHVRAAAGRCSSRSSSHGARRTDWRCTGSSHRTCLRSGSDGLTGCRRGGGNWVQPIGEPTVEYLGIRRDAHDRVVVQIEAKLDFVVDNGGQRQALRQLHGDRPTPLTCWTRRGAVMTSGSSPRRAGTRRTRSPTRSCRRHGPTSRSSTTRRCWRRRPSVRPDGVRLSDLVNVEFGGDVGRWPPTSASQTIASPPPC